MLKKIRAVVFVAFSLFAGSVSAQHLAVKSNLLYDATTTFNLGLEFKLGSRTTFDLPVNYNPWTFSDNRKWKHLLVQPEWRFWTCEAFSGHFFGVHGHYAYFNAGGFGPLTALKDYRYQGWLAGGGLSYGYSWVFSPRWSMEASIGVGYAYINYDKFYCYKCGEKIKSDTHHYFGPTKAAISLIYTIK